MANFIKNDTENCGAFELLSGGWVLFDDNLILVKV